MKVLITGANGFIGRNLHHFLQAENNIEIDTYTLDNSEKELPEKLLSADFIVHLAGVNRPQTPEEFFSGNTDLTKTIIDTLNHNHKTTPLIFSSSIQAALDNDYGKSKRLAEDYILEHYKPGIVFRLHNVFGKECRPNYNSVVATFCDKIAKNEPITIDDPNKEIELIYIDDICQSFISLIRNPKKAKSPYNYVSPVKKISLKHLSEMLYSFKDSLETIDIPNIGDAFTKKLFSTYISYNSINNLINSPIKNTDSRGNFSELIHTKNCGQVSVSTSRPGITRGNHYHHTKVEKFIVLSGEATIRLRKIDTTEVIKLPVKASDLQIVTIPVGYTHSITNTGDTDMVLLIWCNEIFDKNNPDTFYEEV